MVETVEKLYNVRDTFDLVLESINDMVCIVDPKENYKIEMLNQQAFQEILGYSRNELISRSILELVHRDHINNSNLIIEGSLNRIEKIRLLKKDGNFIWSEIKGKRTKNIHAQERLLLILKDITQSDIKEKDFNNAAARFELISSYSDDFYAILNDNFEYEYINDRVYKESLGFDKDEIVGKTALNIIYPDDVKKAVRGLRKGFDTGENSTDIRVRTKNGGYVWVETKGRIFTDDDGNKKALLVGRDVTARKEAEQKLYESEERYRNLINNLTDIVLELDMKGIVTFVSPQCIEAIGFKPDELVGKSAFNVIHSDDVSIVAEAMKEAYQTKTMISVLKYRLLHKNGNVIYASAQGKMVNINGNDNFIATIRDISARVETEQKLKESEEKFKMITEQSMMGILILQGGQVKYANEKLVDIYGIEPDIFYNWQPGEFLNVIHPDYREIVAEQARKKELGMEDSITRYTFKAMKKTGEIVWIENFSKPIIFEERPAILGIHIDITDKIKIEEQLKESEEKYRSLFDNSPNAILLINMKGIIIDCNSTTKNLSGFEKSDLIGKTFFKVSGIPEKHIPQISKDFRAFLKGEIVEPQEIQLYTKDGNLVWVNYQVSQVKLGDEMLIQLIIQDISEKKEAGEELKESEEKYRILFDRSPIGITISNRNNEILLMNDKIKEITGYSKEELNNINFESIYLDKNKYEEIFEIIGAYGAIRDYEVVIRQKNGTEKICLLNVDKHTISNESVFQTTIQDITKSKESEQKLKISEERLSAFKEAAPMSFALLDSELNVVDVNQNTLSRFPTVRTKEDVIGKNITECAPNVKENGRYDKYLEVIKTGKPFYSDDVSVHPKYGNVSLELRAFKVGNGMGVITIDNTERKLIEQQLKESEETYREREKNLIDIIVEMDIDGNVIYISPQVFDILGYNEEELIGTNGYDIVCPDDIPQIQELTMESYKQNKPIYFEFRAKHKDGHYIPMLARGNIIIADNIPKIVGIIKDDSEKKEAETKLRDSEEKYREVVNNLDVGFFQGEIGGKLLMHNIAFNQILGIDPTISIFGLKSAQFISNPKLNEEFHKKLLNDGFIRNFTIEAKTPSGKNIIVEINAHILNDKNGEAKIVEGTLVDITEKFRLELELKESEEKYRNLFDTSPNAIILMDRKGNIQDCNLTTEIMLGYKKEDLVRENYMKLQAFSPTIKPVERIKEMNLKKNIHNPVEIQIKRKDGNPAWITAQISNIKIGGNKLFQIIIKDITEKRKYEELISELNMNFLTFTADIQGNIHLLLNTCCNLLNGTLALFVNKTRRDDIEQYQVITSDKRMFTYDAREFEKSIHLSEFFREEHDYSQILQNVNGTKYANTDHFIQDYSIKGSYGKLIKLKSEYDGLLCVLYEENPLIGHQDDLVMFLICDAIEIEQRRWEAKEQLEAQNEALYEIGKLKSDLLSRTSHELKTPLISIKGFTELLMTRHGYKLDIDMVSILDEIKDGSKRLERIIHSLLQSSKLEQKKVILNKSQEDLSFLIKFCIKDIESLAALRDQTIFLDIENKIIANFDKERLYDVMINLLSNAIKNTPSKGEIKILVENRTNSIVVSVKDSGVGITEEEKKKLFKKFGKIERYGQSWDINIEGTGLGLYIAKKIVKLHGGDIWVESEGRNKGSTFYFSIPKT